MKKFKVDVFLSAVEKFYERMKIIDKFNVKKNAKKYVEDNFSETYYNLEDTCSAVIL